MDIDHKQFGQVIGRLIQKENLSRKECRAMFEEILANGQTDMHQGAFLAALAAKGETAAEIAGVWEALFHLDTVKVKPNTCGAPLLDNCGTGRDSFKTFNISTAASIVAAVAGVKIARHGARAITSSCGTVDLLEELGIDVECAPELVVKSIEEIGIGLFNGMSPKIHPAALGRILSQISFGTVLNIAASLANPALPAYGVRGVYCGDLLEHTPHIMREIGYQRAVVVNGLVGDGRLSMDEASTAGETYVSELHDDGTVTNYSFYPRDVGLPEADIDELKPAASLQEESGRMIRLLAGQETASRSDIVALNAGLILYTAGSATDIREGCHLSAEIIKSGQALAKFHAWVKSQNQNPETGLAKLNHYLPN